jgi:hypothetical protein
LLVLSQISILGENPKIWYRKFKTYGRQNSPKSKFATEPLFRLAFKDVVIASLEHPFIRRLRGAL